MRGHHRCPGLHNKVDWNQEFLGDNNGSPSHTQEQESSMHFRGANRKDPHAFISPLLQRCIRTSPLGALERNYLTLKSDVRTLVWNCLSFTENFCASFVGEAASTSTPP